MILNKTYLVHVQKTFKFYSNSIFSITNDTYFWKSFLDNNIKSNSPENENIMMYESIFHAYNLPHDKKNGLLKTFKMVTHRVDSQNIYDQKEKFFSWIINLSILRAYNSLELLLLSTIQNVYFPTFDNPLIGRKESNKIHSEIKRTLINPDSTNNRYIIKFLEDKSKKFSQFSQQPIRVDITCNWKQFFEILSILRNIVAHHGMIVNNNSYNTINSNSKDVFNRYFVLKKDEFGNNILHFNQDILFQNFIHLINDFGLNTVKFLYNENNLEFLEASSI